MKDHEPPPAVTWDLGDIVRELDELRECLVNELHEHQTALAPALERIALELEIANLYRAADTTRSKEDDQALKRAIGRRRRLS